MLWSNQSSEPHVHPFWTWCLWRLFRVNSVPCSLTAADIHIVPLTLTQGRWWLQRSDQSVKTILVVDPRWDVQLTCSLCVLSIPADALPGVLRWQSRLWQLVTKLRGARQLGDVPCPALLKKKEVAESRKIWDNKNYVIQEVVTPETLGTSRGE